jgi:hypothetical protein
MCLIAFWIVGGVAGIFAVASGLAWLTMNWWIPYVKIETNGLRFRVMQLNRFHLWQEWDNYDSLHRAEEVAKYRVTQWHEKHDPYKPIETHDRVAAKISYFKKKEY